MSGAVGLLVAPAIEPVPALEGLVPGVMVVVRGGVIGTVGDVDVIGAVALVPRSTTTS